MGEQVFVKLQFSEALPLALVMHGVGNSKQQIALDKGLARRPVLCLLGALCWTFRIFCR